MRVTSRRSDDRGAVLIIFAVFMMVAVVFLAFVVDIGNQRQDRRQLTTATDAAALDVAQTWARQSLTPLGSFVNIGSNKWDCTNAAEEYLNANRQVAAGDYECVAQFVNEQFGSVTVTAGGQTDYQVAPAIGIEEGEIASSTSVRIRSTPGGGLRPFGICARDEDVIDWIGDGGPQRDIVLGGDKNLPDECQDQSANWGFVVFETQTTGQKTLAETIRDGTTDPTSSFDNGDEGNPDDPYAAERAICRDDADETPQHLYDDQTPVTCVFNSTGAAGWNNNNALDAFRYLRDEEITFNLPIYGEIEVVGNGQQTGFPIIAYAEVQLLDFEPAGPGSERNELQLRFLNLSTGDCCDVNESNYQLEICDVGTLGGDVVASTFTASCQTYGGSSGGDPTVPPPSDPCTVVSVSPEGQDVFVDSAGALINDERIDVTVADAADCEVVSVEAVHDEASVAGSVGPPASNTYPVTYAEGTVLATGGTEFEIHVFEGGRLRDDRASMTTVTGIPCVVSPPTVNPSAPTAARNKGGQPTGSLAPPAGSTDASVTVRALVSNVDSCSGISMRIIQLPGGTGRMANSPCCTSDTTSYTGTFGGDRITGTPKWDWLPGSYRAEIIRKGVVVASTPFSVT